MLSAAKAKLQAYISAQHRLGRDIRKSAIYTLHVERRAAPRRAGRASGRYRAR
ncbi:hypothetical protein KIF59_16535 [Enterobacter cloacae subsp. cloacae]|nr:hypothetical protein [Enterobacter cloacae subsp. cloacae]